MTSISVESTIVRSDGKEMLHITLWLLALWLFSGLIALPFSAVFYLFHLMFAEQAAASYSAWKELTSTDLMLYPIPFLAILPLLVKATPAKGWRQALDFYGFTQPILKVTALTLTMSTILCALVFLIDLPEEPFMQQMGQKLTSFSLIAMWIFSVCVVAPFIEEFVFRGWLFGRIVRTRLGRLGALLLTSFIFSLAHAQYEHWQSFAVLMLYGLFLGYLRLRYSSCTYSIIAHFTMNVIATLILIFGH